MMKKDTSPLPFRTFDEAMAEVGQHLLGAQQALSVARVHAHFECPDALQRLRAAASGLSDVAHIAVEIQLFWGRH